MAVVVKQRVNETEQPAPFPDLEWPSGFDLCHQNVARLRPVPQLCAIFFF